MGVICKLHLLSSSGSHGHPRHRPGQADHQGQGPWHSRLHCPNKEPRRPHPFTRCSVHSLGSMYTVIIYDLNHLGPCDCHPPLTLPLPPPRPPYPTLFCRCQGWRHWSQVWLLWDGQWLPRAEKCPHPQRPDADEVCQGGAKDP